MPHGAYQVISETTEDRFDETDSLDEAVRIARGLVSESRNGDPISIEHNGKVIRQIVLTPEGEVRDSPIR
jgi:hypothetical protein